MAVLSAQSTVTGFSAATSMNLKSLALVNNSQGGLINQALLKANINLLTGFSNSAQANLSANYSSFVFQSSFQDYLSSFARFFGINARQDATKVYIQKADLPKLNSLINNTVESLFIALLLRAMQFESNDMISRVVIELFKQEFVTINNISMLRSIFVINLRTTAIYFYLEVIDKDKPITPSNINS